MPELLLFAKNRRASRIFFQSKYKILLWVTGGIVAWSQASEFVKSVLRAIISSGK